MSQRLNSVGGGVTSHTIFEQVISLENLVRAWQKFRRGKMRKFDVLAMEACIEDIILELHRELSTGTYRHELYTHFYVYDPKRRYISKAVVKDRIVHQAIVQVFEPIFEKTFIFDSYAARAGKGVHSAVERLDTFLRSASRNYHKSVYALKCDIRKFYDSVSHDALLLILSETIYGKKMMALLRIIVESYAADSDKTRGLPLGNVTSQLFTNIYLNSFDHFIKEQLRMRWYVRFCDDFMIVHPDHNTLKEIVPKIQAFLLERCALTLHPNKVSIRNLTRGVDFVGQIIRPHYRVILTKTKRRIIRRLRMRAEEYRQGAVSDEKFRQSLQSYLGMFKHGSNYRMRQQLKEKVWRLFGAVSV